MNTEQRGRNQPCQALANRRVTKSTDDPIFLIRGHPFQTSVKPLFRFQKIRRFNSRPAAETGTVQPKVTKDPALGRSPCSSGGFDIG
jgi:hypothetical protein